MTGKRAVTAGFLSVTLALGGTAGAEDDFFSFIPRGGRSILEGLENGDTAAARSLLTERTSEQWLARMAEGGLPGAEALDEWDRQTLADYLAYAGAPGLTAAMPGGGDTGGLPWDGRDMALAKCQSCHIITVVITQSRTREAWLGTLNKPSHVEVPLSAAERGQLADYLVVNAGLPIDAIPPELRAGGASY